MQSLTRGLQLLQRLGGGIHLVQSSTNLLDWETIGVAVDCGGGELEFRDAQAARFLRRYYRITSQ